MRAILRLSLFVLDWFYSNSSTHNTSKRRQNMRQQLLSSTISYCTIPAKLFPPLTFLIVLLVPPVLILYEDNTLAVPRTLSPLFLDLTIQTHLILGLQTKIQYNYNQLLKASFTSLLFEHCFSAIEHISLALEPKSHQRQQRFFHNRASRKGAETGHESTSKASPTLKQSLRSFRRCISNLQKSSHSQPA